MHRVRANFANSVVGEWIAHGHRGAFVSWVRPEMTRTQKISADSMLRAKVREMKHCGHLQLLGGWSESEGKIKDPGEVIHNLDENGQPAVFVTHISLEEAMKLAMTEYEVEGVKFGPQDFILHNHEQGMCFVSTNPDYGPVGSTIEVFRACEGMDPLPAAEVAIARYFAQLRWGKAAPEGTEVPGGPEQGAPQGRESAGAPGSFQLLVITQRSMARFRGRSHWFWWGRRQF